MSYSESTIGQTTMKKILIMRVMMNKKKKDLGS
jgi:hypothetical protein